MAVNSVPTLNFTALAQPYGSKEGFYGFFDALETALDIQRVGFEDAILRIYSLGCLVDGVRNCAAACYDPSIAPKAIWNDVNAMHTYVNCLLAPLFVDLALQNMLQWDLSEFGPQFGNSVYGADAVEALGLINSTKYGTHGALAFEGIKNCTRASCRYSQIALPPGAEYDGPPGGWTFTRSFLSNSLAAINATFVSTRDLYAWSAG